MKTIWKPPSIPTITYTGKLLDDISLNKDGKYQVRTKGKFTIRGITKERILNHDVTVTNGQIQIVSSFKILLEDYNITIPKIVHKKNCRRDSSLTVCQIRKMRIGIVFLFCLISWTLTSQKHHFNQHEVSTDLLRMNPTLLYRYQNDLMYIGTKEGLVIYDGNIHKIYQRPDQGSQEVTALYYEKNILWIGYEDGAIFQFYKNGIHPWVIDEGWPKSKITDIFFTANNQLWLATLR
jgi:hypothetical protein